MGRIIQKKWLDFRHPYFSLFIVLFIVQLSGCAGRGLRKSDSVQTHTRITLEPVEIVEIQFLQRNTESKKSETLTLTPARAKVERAGGKKFEPIEISFSEEEFRELAHKTVSFSWEINPIRTRRLWMESLLILKTVESQETVEFGENLSGELKEFFDRLVDIRRKVRDSTK
ncbi:MAG: hypothetical protein ABII23_07960 [bacterium]